jgi:hypothetical protein
VIRIRICSFNWGKHQDGTYILSPQIFAPLKGGCSIEIKSLIDAAGTDPYARCEAHRAFAMVSITVDEVRNLKFKNGDEDKIGLKVAYRREIAQPLEPFLGSGRWTRRAISGAVPDYSSAIRPNKTVAN